jgi:hypothetical protein
MTDTVPDQPNEYQRVLPLSIQERDGHVTIYCTGQECVWSWRLYNGAAETNGRAIDSAIRHALKRHVL